MSGLKINTTIRRALPSVFGNLVIFLITLAVFGGLAVFSAYQNWLLGVALTATTFLGVNIGGAGAVLLDGAKVVIPLFFGRVGWVMRAALAAVFVGATAASGWAALEYQGGRGSGHVDDRAKAAGVLAGERTKAVEARAEIERIDGLLKTAETAFARFECVVESRYARKREACAALKPELAELREQRAAEVTKRDQADQAVAAAPAERPASYAAAAISAFLGARGLTTTPDAVVRDFYALLAVVFELCAMTAGAMIQLAGRAFGEALPKTEEAAAAGVLAATDLRDDERAFLAALEDAMALAAANVVVMPDGALVGSLAAFGALIGKSPPTMKRMTDDLAARGHLTKGSHGNKTLIRH